MLLTSLIDADKFPAKEVVALYHERWEIELAYNEVKDAYPRAIRIPTVEDTGKDAAGGLGTGGRLQSRVSRDGSRRGSSGTAADAHQLSRRAAFDPGNLFLGCCRQSGIAAETRRTDAARTSGGRIAASTNRTQLSTRSQKIKMSNYDRKASPALN